MSTIDITRAEPKSTVQKSTIAPSKPIRLDQSTAGFYVGSTFIEERRDTPKERASNSASTTKQTA